MIDNELLYTKSKGTYSGPTKTDRVRALMLAPQCMDLLKKWQEEQNRLKELYGDKWTENGYVFTRDDGNLMNPDSITDWLNNFSEKHHLPHIHMGLVGMRTDEELILSLCPAHRHFITDTICFFRRNLPGQERLSDLKEQCPARYGPACLCIADEKNAI